MVWNPDKVAPHVQEAYALITTCTKRQFADKVATLKASLGSKRVLFSYFIITEPTELKLS